MTKIANKEELRDGCLDSLKGVNLINITILSNPKKGKVKAKCKHCGKTFLLPLEPIDPSATARILPCGCTATNQSIEQDCAERLVDAEIKLIGQTLSPDKHRRALCYCERDRKYFRARFEALKNGRVRSCGCLRTEQMKKNLAESGKNTKVMGTDTVQLRRRDDRPIKSNTSGHTGVYYATSRRKWVAELHFQRKRYYIRFDTELDAICCRKEMKRIHDEFLQWWDALTDEERTEARAQYSGEQDLAWMLLKDRLDKVFRNNRRNKYANTSQTEQFCVPDP